MQTTHDLIVAVRQLAGSDNKAAPLVGVSQNSFTEWRNGTAFPTAEKAMRIAELLRLDAAYVLAVIERDRAKSAPARQAWQRVAEAFSKAAMLAVIAAAPFMLPPPADAASHNVFLGAEGNTHMRKKRRLLGVML